MVLFSDYGDLPDISYQLSYPSLFFAIFTPLVIIARFAARKSFSGKLGADDWVILVSFVSAGSYGGGLYKTDRANVRSCSRKWYRFR
jgi:hypothetical protein